MSQISAIDQSDNDTLMRWIVVALNPVGSPWDVIHALHENSQGLNKLDRYLGRYIDRKIDRHIDLQTNILA